MLGQHRQRGACRETSGPSVLLHPLELPGRAEGAPNPAVPKAGWGFGQPRLGAGVVPTAGIQTRWAPRFPLTQTLRFPDSRAVGAEVLPSSRR